MIDDEPKGSDPLQRLCSDHAASKRSWRQQQDHHGIVIIIIIIYMSLLSTARPPLYLILSWYSFRIITITNIYQPAFSLLTNKNAFDVRLLHQIISQADVNQIR